jgi:hypothetical protein
LTSNTTLSMPDAPACDTFEKGNLRELLRCIRAHVAPLGAAGIMALRKGDLPESERLFTQVRKTLSSSAVSASPSHSAACRR